MMTNKPSICTECGKEFYVSKSQIKYRGIRRCSNECRAKAQGISKMKTRKNKGSSRTALQNIVNKYARLRDCYGNDGAGCISCDKWTPFDEGDGGHFIPAKISITRYDERNVNHQCRRCNRFMHGNLANYYVGMVRKYGQEVVDELMAAQSQTRKWKDSEIKDMRKMYNEKIKSIERGEDPNSSGVHVSMSGLFQDLSEA